MTKARAVLPSVMLVIVLAGVPPTYAGDAHRRVSQGEAAVVATVKVGRYPHGIAVNEETHRVYVANLNGGSVSVLDDRTNQVVATVQVGKGPRDVAVNRRTNRAYVPCIAAQSASPTRRLGLRLLRPIFTVLVMDGQTYETLGQVPVGTNPWLVEVSERTNRIYVANCGSYSVSVIDGDTLEVMGTIEMGLFRTPGGMAVNEEANRVYIADTLHLGPLDLGSGRLLVVHGDTHAVLHTVSVGRRAQVAVNERTNRVYVTSRQSGTLSVIDGRTNELMATLDVGPDPYGVAVSEEANRIYVANHDGRSVSVIDGQRNELLYTVEVGASPVFVAVNEATGRVYVTNSGDDTLTVLDSGKGVEGDP